VNVPAWVVLGSLLVAGCSGSGEAALTVNLRTDLAPVEEFASVRTEIGTAVSTDHTAFRGEPYPTGVRVAEESGLAPGPTTVRVTLLDGSAMPVASRELRVELSESGCRLHQHLRRRRALRGRGVSLSAAVRRRRGVVQRRGRRLRRPRRRDVRRDDRPDELRRVRAGMPCSGRYAGVSRRRVLGELRRGARGLQLVGD
jgi:hypothetical protein